ncbi:MAG: polysaccharide deacetylase family protein [Verrucomicrobiota bacterium]|jgi:oligosaccharide reducing-end xylanase
MKTSVLFFFIMTFIASASLAGSIASPYEVGTWRGFRPAAISYTFDDGCSNQFTVAIPMFDQKGFKLTLFTVTGNSMFPGWSKLQAAAAKGHEIASHTVTHANFGKLPDSQQATELKDSKDAISTNIPGQKCVTMAYPYCVPGNDSLVSQYYIAARTCSGQLVPANPANFMEISSFVCGTQGAVKTAQDFNNKANQTAATKRWCVYLIHGIDNDGGYSPITTATLQGSIDYLSANKDKFWVETFGNVARYILERNAASVRETAAGNDSITLQVTDNLDDTIFNYPITLRRPLPENWLSAAVSQNNKPVNAQIVDVASKKYVMFDVVPDGGNVIITRN